MNHWIKLLTALAASAVVASTAAAFALAGVAGPGVRASLLGTTKRKDGQLEVTYNRHPLYYFVTDRKPGQTTGQGVNQFGGPWWVLSAAGKEIHRG